jgi:hypothetical protein
MDQSLSSLYVAASVINCCLIRPRALTKHVGVRSLGREAEAFRKTQIKSAQEAKKFKVSV